MFANVSLQPADTFGTASSKDHSPSTLYVYYTCGFKLCCVCSCLNSVQDAAAAEFTSLTKALYDLQKGQESADCRGSPLYQLVVENFDEEQIWQELELQNSAVLKHFETAVQQAVSDDTLSIVQEEEDDEVEEGMGDEEDAGSSKALLADNAENVTDDDSDVNFDVDTLEKKVQQKKLPAKKASKQLGVPSEVDDRFFKLSEMESFLDDMDKREGKEGVGEEDVDYFQDLPSGDEEEEDLNFENLPPKKHNKKSMVCVLVAILIFYFMFLF